MAIINAKIDHAGQTADPNDADYSGLVTEQELQAIASDAMVSASSPSAEPVFDASGKLIEVKVNLPDTIAASDLQNAKDAISANKGVATVSTLPPPMTEDFTVQEVNDGNANPNQWPNAVTDSLVARIGEPLNSLVSFSTGVMISDDEALSATRSLLMSNEKYTLLNQITGSVITTNHTPDSATFSLVETFQASPSQPIQENEDLTTLYNAIKCEFDLYVQSPTDITSGRPGTDLADLLAFETDLLTVILGTKMTFKLDLGNNFGAPATNKASILAFGGQSAQEFTTAFVYNQWNNVKMEWDGRTGTASATLTIGASPETLSFSTLTGLIRSPGAFVKEWSPSTGSSSLRAVHTGKTVERRAFIDDLTVQILNIVGM